MSANMRLLLAAAFALPAMAGLAGTSVWAAAVSYTPIAAGTTVDWQGVDWALGTKVAPSLYKQPQSADVATIGGAGTGTMYLDGTAAVTSLYVSGYSGDTGVALELRSNARLTTTGDSSMGHVGGGWGIVNMNGGTWTVTAGKRLDVGQATATNGTSTLNMHGGTLTTPTLNVAYLGSGTLNQDGGWISATTTVVLGGANNTGYVSHYNLSAVGTLQTKQLEFKYQNSDASQAWSMTGGTLKTAKIQYDTSYGVADAVFTQDDGTLAPVSITGTTFSDVGTLSFANTIPAATVGYTMGSHAHLALQLASVSSYDKVVMTGAFTVGGTLDVTLAGYTPSVGDTFTLFSADGGYHGSFSQINLPAGATWDTSALLTNGTLTVSAIPEPISATLLGLGALALLPRRRMGR